MLITQHLRFFIFPRNPGTQQNFPLYRRLGYCHIFQAVKIFFGSRPEQPELAFTLVHPLQFSSYHYRTFMDPSLQRSTWPSNFSVFAIRYVDNRYIFFPKEKVQEPSIQVSFCEDSYQHPVKLEEVTTNELLGFLLISTFERWPINSHNLDHLVFLHRLDKVHQECRTQHFRFRIFQDIQAPKRLFFPIVQASLFRHIFQAFMTFINIQWNWSKSPAMNCWVFLLTKTFKRWPKNSDSLNHLGFPPPVGQSPPGVSNTARPFSNFSRNSGTQQIFCPLYRRLFVLPHFQAVNWNRSPAMNCWVFLLTKTFKRWHDKLRQPQPPWFSSTGWTKSTMSVQHSTSVFDFSRTQAPTDFPIVQASLLCHIFQTVNVVVFFFWAADWRSRNWLSH